MDSFVSKLFPTRFTRSVTFFREKNDIRKQSYESYTKSQDILVPLPYYSQLITYNYEVVKIAWENLKTKTCMFTLVRKRLCPDWTDKEVVSVCVVWILYVKIGLIFVYTLKNVLTWLLLKLILIHYVYIEYIN